MSSIRESVTPPVVPNEPAANADQLDERPRPPSFTDTGSGWDAYEVWRRFIKHARDRRAADHHSS